MLQHTKVNDLVTLPLAFKPPIAFSNFIAKGIVNNNLHLVEYKVFPYLTLYNGKALQLRIYVRCIFWFIVMELEEQEHTLPLMLLQNRR